MIDCPNSEIRDLLPDLLHGSLSSADRVRVEAHLAACDACSQELALLRRVYDLNPVVAMDAEAVAGSIKSYRRPPLFSLPPLVRIAASIAVIAVGGASFGIIANNRANVGAGVGETLAVLTNDSLVPAVIVVDSATSAALGSLDEQTLSELLAEIKNMDVVLSEEPRKLIRSPGSGDDE